MKSAPYIPTMVQAITVLTVLKMMTKAQTSCGQGAGRVLYERLPNHQLQGFDDDVVRDTAPPFTVLEKCQDLCLRDRTSSNNIVRTCSSFDFQPGSRIASFSGSPEYEESTCYLTREQAVPEGIGNLMLVPNSVHFTEVCITSNRPERECPNRRYVFERHPRKKLKLPQADLKEVSAANRSDCEDRCLNEFSFVCRSASFDSSARMCTLSRFTRRTHPELLEDDANSDYLENTCLNAERRCDGLAVFIKEENKRLGGPFEVEQYTNLTLEECQSLCLRAEKYFCRSIEFDEMTKQCILSEEDSISQKDDLGISSSPTHHFYDLVCLDNPRGSEYPDNSVTSHLFSNGRRPDTAFQRYRNSRLGGEFHSEITGRSLSECLDECLRQTSFQCLSAVYSDRFRTCRLSRFNQRNGMRVIYDADYDYYENLMLGDGEGGSGMRPDPMGQDTHYFGHGRPTYYPPSSGGGDRYPPGRYPPGGDRYPPGGNRYPSGGDRRPGGGDRYPPGGDRYPPGSDRYPPGGDRYRPGGDRYPSGGDRYPPGGDRYQPGGDRYPPGGDRYPPGGDRYPPGGDRYPSGGDRYPPGRDRYPSGDRYPGGERYPIGPDRYPSGGDRYQPGGDRYPPGGDRYPSDRYPSGGDRYPSTGDRYPAGNDRFPPNHRYPYDRYPGNGIDRYPGRYPPGDRYYPSIGDRYAPGSDRYPSTDRYPPGSGYPPGAYPPADRYPVDRYPSGSDRYPPGGKYPPSGRYPSGDRYPVTPDKTATGDRTPPADRYPTTDRAPAGPDKYPTGDRYPVSERYPTDRFPTGDRYPAGERYPGGRYPTGDRAPIDRYPTGGYPPPDRFPSGGDRYPTGGYPAPDRFPVGGDRYPTSPDRYPASGTGGRYPISSSGGNRYPADRYPNGDGRYPVGPPRYPDDRYPPDRYGADRYNGFHEGGDRWYYSGRRPGYDGGGYRGPGGFGRPVYGGPPDDVGNGYSSFGGVGPGRPFSSRCDEGDNFKQVGVRQRVRKQFVRRFTTATSLAQCQRECVEARDFICRSFNYKDASPPYENDRDNCELSDRDSRDLDLSNPTFFDTAGNYDYYERSAGRDGIDGECLDVSQVCNEDGMEFTLRTPEGFSGRIYTYGFYDRCFFRGNGGTVNVLRISGAQGYPECGTQRFGDTLTNVVVVQFSDNVQTGRDKRFNLTCLFRGPGEAVVTSGYIGAGSGSPIPIEYLPAENSLSSKVRLMILYQGRPTTTIAVGDPLTFRIESQDGYNYANDIFATNVIARDPYSGRSVQLIDRYGCPVDSYVFPELDKSREGDTLEARFNAFKIPESNFLVFEATVRTCRDGCQPAYCSSGSGRSEPSFGKRRRRHIDSSNEVDGENTLTNGTLTNRTLTIDDLPTNETASYNPDMPKDPPEYPEFVREMIEVFESREELQQEARKSLPLTETVCLTSNEYRGMLGGLLTLVALLICVCVASGLAYRRYWTIMRKNSLADRSSLPSTRGGMSLFGGGFQRPFSLGRATPTVCDPDCVGSGGMFEDPSEPIYTDPSLFERSRSLRSISVSQKRRMSADVQHI